MHVVYFMKDGRKHGFGEVYLLYEIVDDSKPCADLHSTKPLWIRLMYVAPDCILVRRMVHAR